MLHKLALAVIALASVLSMTTRAAAEDDDGLDTPYVAPKLMLGFGGGTSVDFNADSVLTALDNEESLEPSYGIGLAGFNPMGLFALGGQLALISWGEDREGASRSLFFEVSALPQLNLALEIFEIYLNVPIGLTVDFADDDAYGPGNKVHTGLGYHLGFMLGARVGLGDLGLLAEVGFIHRAFSHEVENEALMETWDVDMELDQAALNVGVYF
jgi:hypothetical protein